MDKIASARTLAVRQDGQIDFYETVKLFYSHMVKVVKPTPCNNYDLLDMETKVNCSVKLENVSEAGDVMSRAYLAIIIGSVLRNENAEQLLVSNDEKRIHICLTDSNPALMLHLKEVLVAATMMGFKSVIHLSINDMNVLEIERLVYAKMLNAEFKYLQLPIEFMSYTEDEKMKWYENYVKEETDNSELDIVIDYSGCLFYGLVGLACAAYEIVEQKDVSAIVVPDLRSDASFSTLPAFALFAKALKEKFPEKDVKIIPATLEEGMENAENGEFMWVLNHNPSLHSIPAFDYLLNLKTSFGGVQGDGGDEYNEKGLITRAHLSEFFHSIIDKYPPGVTTPVESSMSLYKFKKYVANDEVKCKSLVDSKLHDVLAEFQVDKLIENGLVQEPLVVSEAHLARGFMTGFKITRTFGGKYGAMGLAGVLMGGGEMEEKYNLSSTHVCVLMSGASVNVTLLESDIQWAQLMNGELCFVEAAMPSETEFMQRILTTLRRSSCSLVDVTRTRDYQIGGGITYTLRIGCQNIQSRNAAFAALKLIDHLTITKTVPEIDTATEFALYDVPIKSLCDYPFEDEEHPFHLPNFTIEEITTESCEEAEKRLLDAHLIYPTPIVRSEIYSKLCDCNVYLQLDNLQQTGSFKQRGSANAILKGIVESGVKPKHVVAVSAGNHSQGVSLCCRYLGIPCTIVCPVAAPVAKMEATRKYGATVIRYGKSFEEALQHGFEQCERLHATFVHPFNHPGVIEGQSSAAVAFHREVPDLDTILVNVGGGGLISGVASYLRRIKDYKTSLGKKLRIIGLQGGNVAPLDTSSVDPSLLRKGIWKYVPMTNSTIADGCNVKVPGGIHDVILRDLVDEYLGVPENFIATAVSHLLVSTRTLVEGAGAIGVAAMMYGLIKVEPSEKVGIIVCGGNINVDHLVQCAMYGMRACGRMLTVQVDIPDNQTSLENIINIAEACCIRFLDVQYLRSSGSLAAEIATLRVKLSCASFESQNEFLIRLVKELNLVPTIFGREAVPHHTNIYGPFDTALEESLKAKKEAFDAAEAEWYGKETERLHKLREKYPAEFLE